MQESQLDVHELGRDLDRRDFVSSEKVDEETVEQLEELITKNSIGKGNATFHKLFPGIPSGETLTHTFSCALQKEVLYQGKLFVSKKHVCFHSSVLLKDTKVVIDVSDVKQVKKQSLALSMLSIRTLAGEKYSFVSLRNRDWCYKLLQSLCPHTQGLSLNSSPHVSSTDNQDADTISCPSSLDGSVEQWLERDSNLPGNDFTRLSKGGPRQRYSSSPRRSRSREQVDHGTDNECVCVCVCSVVLLLLSSGYIGLRIVALENQLNSLGAVTDFSRHHTE
ncbi:GRAM domain-containing protein 2A-like [Aplochiton taeniatus]